MTTPEDATLTGEIASGDVPPLKPGIATTEFWVTLVTAVLTFAVGVGWIGPDFAKAHEGQVNALALLASVLAPAAYALARSIAKNGHQRAAAQVAAVQASVLPVIEVGAGKRRA